MMPQRPPFDQLPLKEGDPPFSAWGLYGPDDQLGSLRLLTDENTVASARSEIQTGARLSLDPPLDALLAPASQRASLEHKIIRLGGQLPIHDDTVSFNTQSGAQWDGLRHATYLSGSTFYNNNTLTDLKGGRGEDPRLGIHNWVEAGGIVGRGVLLDFYSYAQGNNIQYDLIGEKANYSISVQDLQACAAAQGLELRYGDILFLRSGFWAGYNQLSDEDKYRWSQQEWNNTTWVGVETSSAMARWIWESGISAVAGDAPAWERIPLPVPNTDAAAEAGLGGVSLHEILLGGWGMPIGEMFDLERLSEECKRRGRWSFFVTSAPIHVRGGVASPPNVLAMF